VRSATAIRIIDVLITLCMILSIGIAALFLWSAIQIPSIYIGQATQLPSNGSLMYDLPVLVSNRSPLSLSGMTVDGSAGDCYGNTILRGTAGPISISGGSNTTVNINIVFNLSGIPPEVIQKLATADSNLTVNVELQGAVNPFLNVMAKASGAYSWGAPLKDLSFGEVTLEPYNATHCAIKSTLTFWDNSHFLGVNGEVSGSIMDNSGREVGEIEPLTLNIAPGTGYSGGLNGYVLDDAFSNPPFTLKLVFSTQFGDVDEEVTFNPAAA
jgi:hypothetical protein